MKFTAVFLLATLLSFSSVAQDLTCASGEIHEHLLETDSLYQRSFFHLEQRIREMREEVQQRASVVQTIPVVVHVIHMGEALGDGTNISDEQVYSAITALNEDFRKTPGSPGDGAGVDMEIEFCLAARDPEGNATTGINRVDGTVVTGYAEEGIQATGSEGADELTVKQLSTWPREDYVNIWVVNEIENNDGGGGIQGFAYFPLDSPLDGITILHNAIGTVGNLKPNTDDNRTLTHEVGHYFALYHTFHSSSDCEESNCETQGDRVCDTPVTVLNSTCSSPACSGTQQVENYMDYTPGDCRNMFTSGQSDRAWATLLSDRSTLLSSLGCDPVSDLDAGIYNISNPTGGICSGDVIPEITIANYGSLDLTSVTIEYGPNNYAYSYEWTGTLAAGMTESLTLPPFVAMDGDQEFWVRTVAPNGGSDQVTGNDTGLSSFSVGAGAQVTLTITVDYFGQETTWEIRDTDDYILASGGPFDNNQQGTEYVENMCFPIGCYTLHILDDFGDGMSFTNGSYLLEDGSGNILASGGGDFGDEAIHEFCADTSSGTGDPVDPPIAGMEFDGAQVCESNQVDFNSTSTGEGITTYSWTFEGAIPDAASGASPNGIVWYTPGTYTVGLTVTNAAGSHSTEEQITIQPQPSLALTSSDVTCAGAADGSISATLTGTGDYTFTWNTGDTGTSLTGIGGGFYSVTASAAGCQASATTTIDEPDEIQLNLLTWDEDCSGNPGNASVAPGGGTGSLVISWSSGGSGTDSGALLPGDYSVLVTDATGCTKSEAFSIAPSAPLGLEVNTQAVDCHGASTGSAEVVVSGGTGNYTYSWSSGSSASSTTGLSAGNYAVTVYDDGGCESTQEFSIDEPLALQISLDATDALCYGESNGVLSASASGGVGGLSILWNTGATGADLMNIPAGSYSAEVTDANGCTAQANATISQPDLIAVSVFKQNVTCFGLGDGSAQASANGGVGSLSYQWDSGQTTQNIEGLGAGFYTVTISDQNDCSQSESIQVEEPAEVLVNLTALDIACGENAGSAYVDPSGGVGFYTVSWSTGQNTMEIADLNAGTYSVDIEDANGCSASAAFEIVESASLVLDVSSTDVTCSGMSNGLATVNVNGGDGNYTYDWSSGSSSPSVDALQAGDYTLSVVDASGCEGMAAFTISEPDPISISIFKSDISCHGESDGTASAFVIGGSAPYSFAWSTGSEAPQADHLEAGTHSLTVQDENLCEESKQVTIIEPSAIVVSLDLLTSETCEGDDGSCIANGLGGTGMLTYAWSNGSVNQMNDNLGAGVYEVTITDSNGCSVSETIVIPMDCGDGTSTTELSAASCEGQNLTLDDYVYCQEVPNAEMYMWRFENLSIGLLSEVYSAGNNPSFWLGDVPNLFYGMSMATSVRVMVSGVWGPYSNPCTMSMAAAIPWTALVEEDCDRTDVVPGDYISAEAVTGATVYEWQFTNENHTVLATSFVPTLEITADMELESDALYAVDIRSQVGPDWSAWGDVCPLTMGNTVGMEVFAEGEPSLIIFPNPTDGQNISFELANLSMNSHVLDLELYDSSGQLIERFKVQTGQNRMNHSFQQQLSSGVYILRYKIDTLLREERLIVR